MRGLTCSGRKPRPSTRAGRRASGGNHFSSRNRNGGFRASVAAEHATDDVVLYPHLQPLRPARWRLAPRLHAGQIGVRHMAGAERHGQQEIRRRHRVLDREVDADAADGRHGMSCVADAEQPRPVPSPETVHANGQQLEIIEALDFSRAPLEERRQLFEIVLECGDAPLADVGEGALGDDISRIASSRRGRS